MTRVLVSLYLSMLPPIDTAHERDVSELPDPTPAAMACITGGCCDDCRTLQSGMQSCIGCMGSSDASACEGTYVPCPPQTCWHGSGKANIYTSGGVSNCDPA